MVQKLLRSYLKIDSISDRDSYQSKRVDSCGPLIGNLLSQSLVRLTREMKTNIQKEISTDLKFTRDKLINKFELVSREEFEVLKKLVQKQELAIKKLSKNKKFKKAKKS